MTNFIQKNWEKNQERYHRFKGFFPATINGIDYKLNFEDRAFWELAANGDWEPETFKVLSKFLNNNSTFIDIGAWIGPTVLYAAKKCKNVICFEPDPVAFRKLLLNLSMNKIENVGAFNIALSDRSATQKMSSFGGHLGDSMTSLINDHSKAAFSFDALVLDWKYIEPLYNLERVDLLKIDVEGGEFSLVPQLEDFFAKHKPTVWLSIHAPYLEENKRQGAVENIIKVMSRNYKTCLNAKFEKIAIDDLKSEENLKSFPAFLFQA